MVFPTIRSLISEQRDNIDLSSFVEDQIEWLDNALKIIEALKTKVAENIDSFEQPEKKLLAAGTVHQLRPATKSILKKHVLKAGPEWQDWYEKNSEYVRSIFGDHAERFLKILAATSAGSDPSSNVSLAIRAFKTMVENGELSPEQFVGLKFVRQNLSLISRGKDPIGPKISPYAKALAGDVNAVAVDRHVFEIIFGTQKQSERRREIAIKLIIEVAQDLGLTPRQVQASLWAVNQIKKGVTPGNYINMIERRKQELVELLNEIRR